MKPPHVIRLVASAAVALVLALVPTAGKAGLLGVLFGPSGLALDETHFVGAPFTSGALAVFPIYATEQADLGDFVTLDAALESGDAEVREVGAAPEAPTPAPAPAPEAVEGVSLLQRLERLVTGSGPDPGPSASSADPLATAQQQVPNAFPGSVDRRSARLTREPVQQLAGHGDGARVNQLIIENKGDKPILVLAGTVVKGGKQDRQIGQDFVVGPKSVVPVDAFCVEHGRWQATRGGQATGGKFSAVRTLAVKKVRTAAQHERDQGKVWSKVAEVNAGVGKAPASGTLLATLDDEELKARREKLAEQIAAYFDALPHKADVVGLAYAVGGEVRSVRWFFGAKVFGHFRPTLVNTAVVEALAVATADGDPATTATAEDVQAFVKAMQAAPVKETRDTAAGNVNDYAESEKGFRAGCRLKAAPDKPVSMDFTSR